MLLYPYCSVTKRYEMKILTPSLCCILEECVQNCFFAIVLHEVPWGGFFLNKVSARAHAGHFRKTVMCRF